MSNNTIIECIRYAEGPGLSISLTVHTIADEKHPHAATRILRLDQVEQFNEHGLRCGFVYLELLAPKVAATDGWSS